MEEDLQHELMFIQAQIYDLKKEIFSDNRAKAEKYATLEQQLKKVKMKVSKTEIYTDEHGKKHLKVFYEVPCGDIYLDENGTPQCNDLLREINLLNLIPYEDMEKIQKEMQPLYLDYKKD